MSEKLALHDRHGYAESDYAESIRDHIVAGLCEWALSDIDSANDTA